MELLGSLFLEYGRFFNLFFYLFDSVRQLCVCPDVFLELVQFHVVLRQVFIQVCGDLVLNLHETSVQFWLLRLRQGATGQGRTVKVRVLSEELLGLGL